MPARGCISKKADGSDCGSAAKTGSNFCLWHDPERAAEAAAVRALGGTRRLATGKSEYPGPIATTQDLVDTLNLAIADCWGMEMSERRMRSLSPLLKILRDLVPDLEVDRRLSTLEALVFSEKLLQDSAVK